MFPATTQALVRLPDTARFVDAWAKTQFGKLATDTKLQNFWNTQRDDIRSRLSEAGWQLSVDVDDIEAIADGQTAFGWIARDGEKPYSVAAVVDIGSRDLQAADFLKRVAKELKAREASESKVKILDVEVTRYQWPSPANPKNLLQSYYVINKGQLIATDDERTMQELLDAQSGSKADSLFDSKTFREATAKLPEMKEIDIEYFVNPLGMVKLLREVGGRPKKNQPDILKLLTDQGFGAVRCITGNLDFASEQHDMVHNGFVKLEQPVEEPVKILTFPNVKTFDVPSWLSTGSASVTAFSWDLKEAFPRFKYLVDGYVNSPGTFDSMMDGIKTDIQGPQIDIAKEVLPLLSSQFFIVTEITEPITPVSKRSLVAVKLNDPEGKFAEIVERYGSNEPQGQPLDVPDTKYRIWSFLNETDDVEVELDFAAGTKKSTAAKEDKNQTNDDSESEGDDEEEPLLDQWAISVVDGYFLFASDAELLMETIERVKSNDQSLFKEADVARANEIIQKLLGEDSHSLMQIDRTDKSFEMQYELFREGQLSASRSVAAAILDRILDPKKKNKDKQQKISGNALPPFAEIRSYFMPAGTVSTSSDEGWLIQSFILAPEKKD
ncbi:MAG: hypothetical protein MUC83_18685 [Pirellula sp.]|nr:hypothetical protein [Pirellula sp.]